MTQLTNLVLKDGQATPANHTFAPASIAGGVATLVESTGVPIGDKRLTASLVSTSVGRRKVTLKMAVPVVQDAQVNGVTKPTVVRTAYCDVVFTFDGASNKQERKDMRAYVVSLLSDTAMIAPLTDDLSNLF